MNKISIVIFFTLITSFVFAQKTDKNTAKDSKQTTLTTAIKDINNATDVVPTVNTTLVNCKPAEDSFIARKNRGEVSFYLPTKYTKDQYFYYIIDKDKYSRKQFSDKMLSKDFLSCYNKLIQHTLDSIYKIDFFRKSDSILTAYDKQGKGYRNTDYPGGLIGLQKFLDKNVALPSSAKPIDADKNIRVYYSFVVDENGSISEYKLLKSNCKECESILLDAVKKLPNFIPATEAGTPKKVKYILPYTKAIKK
jgi:hypothetical protein